MFRGPVVTVPAGGTVTAGTVAAGMASQLVHPVGWTSSPSTFAAPWSRTLPAAVIAPFGSIDGYAMRTNALVRRLDSRLELPMLASPSDMTQNVVADRREIGRASCRERVTTAVAADASEPE